MCVALGACGLLLIAEQSVRAAGAQTDELPMSTSVLAGQLPGAITPAIATRCVSVADTVRVRLTIGADSFHQPIRPVRDIIEEIWGREGVSVSWAGTDGGWEDVDLWVALLGGMTLESGVMGEVRFHGQTPRRLARISIDAVVAWVREHEQARLGVRLSPDSRTRVGDTTALVARALGYAAAHEIGHFLLETRTHGSSGLMAAAFRRPDRMQNGLAWRLDPESRKRLEVRRTQTACRAAPLLAGR
jgi:hypothetical protein